MTAYRTVGVTVAGLLFLLALAAIAGWMKLPATLVENLGYAGSAMVLGQAAKAGMERVAQARNPR